MPKDAARFVSRFAKRSHCGGEDLYDMGRAGFIRSEKAKNLAM